ncbi:PilN domain-containing protein [Tenacibaculum sp. 190524A02b]|uniref:PilN domain-containing protein n=1 Tax=Tenacibaculum vairaonense TaxID=3137860 RepID=UPI0031FA4C91
MLKERLLYGNTYCSVEHTITENGKEVFYVLLLTKKNKELVIKETADFYNQEEVINFLKENKQQHIVLVINNQQVLTKTVESVEESFKVLQRAYSNLNLKDFYSQIKTASNKSFVTLARKSYVDEVINSYQIKGITPLDFSLGNLSLFSLTGVFSNKESIYTSNAKVYLENNQLISIATKQFSEENYLVNGLTLKNNKLLTLGAIVDLYLSKQVYQGKERIDEFVSKTIFTKGFKVALIAFFVALLFNFIAFNSYYSKVQKLSDQLDLYRDNKEKLTSIQETVLEKKKFLQEIQNYSSTSYAKYIDQISNFVPASILLTEFNFQPFKATIKEGKEISNQLHQINIKGVLKKENEFSNWIDAIEKIDWVKEVSKLAIDNDKKNRFSKFNITITIKNEL